MRLRRSMLFVPGNAPAMLRDAHIYGPDSVMFDLEDAVSPREKDAARHLVFRALKDYDYAGVERIVRINGLDSPYGLEDVQAVVAGGADAIRLPKTDSPEDVLAVEKAVEAAERRFGRPSGSVGLIAAIESARGILSAREIASSSPRLVAIAIGAEDFVTDMHTTRSADGVELLAARGMLVMAARAAGIMAIDTVFTGVDDEEGFLREARLAKQLGFDGKSVIHPSQIALLLSVYSPSEAELVKARRVIAAAADAEAKGSGVVSLDGKMIDKPIVERARRVLALAGEDQP
ncbi:MAG: citrate lyase subunit beta [Spirochaetae bacterium HGW-Spirochaetae-3]|nr:MAG: citrate lyase subunit beta [Spirochaetae bacterium HGW-Spirochaetae-3]